MHTIDDRNKEKKEMKLGGLGDIFSDFETSVSIKQMRT